MRDSRRDGPASKWDEPELKDIKRSPTIKRENRSPSHHARRRLRSPVIMDDRKPDIKPKRSRLSSPIVVDDTQNSNESRSREPHRRYKPERSPPQRHRRPSGDRGRRPRDNQPFISDRDAPWGKQDTQGDAKRPENSKPKEQPNFELSGKWKRRFEVFHNYTFSFDSCLFYFFKANWQPIPIRIKAL